MSEWCVCVCFLFQNHFEIDAAFQTDGLTYSLIRSVVRISIQNHLPFNIVPYIRLPKWFDLCRMITTCVCECVCVVHL